MGGGSGDGRAQFLPAGHVLRGWHAGRSVRLQATDHRRMSDPHRRVCLAGGRPVAAQCADRRGCHGLCRRAVQSRGARLSRGRSRGTQDRSVRDVQRLLPVGDPARPAGWISIAGAGFPDHGAGRRRCVRPTHRRAAGRTAPTPGRLGARKKHRSCRTGGSSFATVRF